MVNGGLVCRVVEQFIGKAVKPTEKAREIYTIFPSVEPRMLQLHRNTQQFQLGLMVYLMEVPPSGGAFTVLPGNHRTVCHSLRNEFYNEAGLEHEAVMKQLNHNITPLELIGSPGDCIFSHHRLVHSGGLHTTPGQAHMAIPCDFQQNDWGPHKSTGGRWLAAAAHGPRKAGKATMVRRHQRVYGELASAGRPVGTLEHLKRSESET